MKKTYKAVLYYSAGVEKLAYVDAVDADDALKQLRLVPGWECCPLEVVK